MVAPARFRPLGASSVAAPGRDGVYDTEWVIVPLYTPAAVPPGTVTVMVGFQVAELSPVIPDAVTAAPTAVRSPGLFAVYVAVPILVIVPAL